MSDQPKPCPCCESIQVRIDELTGEVHCMDCGIKAERLDLWNVRPALEAKVKQLEEDLEEAQYEAMGEDL